MNIIKSLPPSFPDNTKESEMKNEDGNFIYICNVCGQIKFNDSSRCHCGGVMCSPCERIGCDKPGYKSIYGMGYLATVCREHYEQSTQQDKDDAIRFRYAEG